MQANKEAAIQMWRKQMGDTAVVGKSEIKKCKNKLTGKPTWAVEAEYKGHNKWQACASQRQM